MTVKFVRVGTETGKMSHAAALNVNRTVCGIRIAPVDHGKPFEPEHEAACQRCVEFAEMRTQ